MPAGRADLRELLLRHRLLVLPRLRAVRRQGRIAPTTAATGGRCWSGTSARCSRWSSTTTRRTTCSPAAACRTTGTARSPNRCRGCRSSSASKSPGAAQGGETLFCDTARVWDARDRRRRGRQWRRDRDRVCRPKRWLTTAGASARRWSATHPLTGETTLRFAEPANAATVRLNTPESAGPRRRRRRGAGVPRRPDSAAVRPGGRLRARLAARATRDRRQPSSCCTAARRTGSSCRAGCGASTSFDRSRTP